MQCLESHVHLSELTWRPPRQSLNWPGGTAVSYWGNVSYVSRAATLHPDTS